MHYSKQKPNTSKPSVTIAIPAYNEERTIEDVLSALLTQSKTRFTLDQIIVYSDGCSDTTVERVKKMQKNSSYIRLSEGIERHGKNYQLNRMFQECQSDLLMVLDADIGLSGNDFLDTFVSAAISDKTSSMFAAHQIPLRPHDLAGKMYYACFLMWDYIRLSVPKKDHMQNFYGAATIYRKQFLRDLHIPDEIKEERMFLYLMAKKRGGFTYVNDASILYWSPHTTADFKKLSERTFGSDEIVFEKIFGNAAKNAATIPRKYKIIGLTKFLRDHPFYFIPAFFLTLQLNANTKRNQKKQTQSSGMWEIASSTKKPVSTARIIFSNYDDAKNPAYAGGGAIAVHEVAKRLTEEFDVTVLTGNYPGAKNEIIDNVTYVRIGLPLFPGPIGQLLYHFFLPWHVLTKRYDVWIESFTPPFSTSFIPLFTKKPVIGLVHMLSGQDMVRKYHLPFDHIENFGLKKYRHFIVMTKESAEQIKRHNPIADVKIIGNGVKQQPVREHGNFDEDAYLSFVGRIEIDQKGLDLLLEAYAEAIKKVDIKLKIAGSGSPKEMEHLSSLIDKYNLKSKVTLCGRIDGAQKDMFLNTTSIGIIPSRYETLSLVALEMMSYGIPSIIFDIRGVKWIPSDAIVRVPPFDTTKLAEAIVSLVQNNELRQRLSKRAYAVSQQYDWSVIAKNYETYIKDVITKHD